MCVQWQLSARSASETSVEVLGALLTSAVHMCVILQSENIADAVSSGSGISPCLTLERNWPSEERPSNMAAETGEAGPSAPDQRREATALNLQDDVALLRKLLNTPEA